MFIHVYTVIYSISNPSSLLSLNNLPTSMMPSSNTNTRINPPIAVPSFIYVSPSTSGSAYPSSELTIKHKTCHNTCELHVRCILLSCILLAMIMSADQGLDAAVVTAAAVITVVIVVIIIIIFVVMLVMIR